MRLMRKRTSPTLLQAGKLSPVGVIEGEEGLS